MNRSMYALTFMCLALGALALMTGARAQVGGDRISDERAIRAAASEYVAAASRGDGEAITRMWTADGDYVDSSGHVFKVQDLIGQQVAGSRPDADGAASSVATSSLRFITPDVAIEDGTAELGKSSDGSLLSGRFTAVWVKQRGRWLLSSLREAVTSAPATNDQLQSLSWLLGEWIGTADGAVILLSSQWSADGKYIVREFLIRRDGHEDISATQRIGWDASVGEIKTWTFDSQGNSSEGIWRGDGERWLVDSTEVLADGKKSKTSAVYIPVDDEQFISEVKSAWEAKDAKAAGTNLRTLRVEFKRAPEDE